MENKQIIVKRLSRIGILTLITTIVWISLEGYYQLVKREQFTKIQDLLAPINPKIRLDLLEKIEERQDYVYHEDNINPNIQNVVDSNIATGSSVIN